MFEIAGGIVIAVVALLLLAIVLKLIINWWDYPSPGEIASGRCRASGEFDAKYPASSGRRQP